MPKPKPLIFALALIFAIGLAYLTVYEGPKNDGQEPGGKSVESEILPNSSGKIRLLEPKEDRVWVMGTPLEVSWIVEDGVGATTVGVHCITPNYRDTGALAYHLSTSSDPAAPNTFTWDSLVSGPKGCAENSYEVAIEVVLYNDNQAGNAISSARSGRITLKDPTDTLSTTYGEEELLALPDLPYVAPEGWEIHREGKVLLLTQLDNEDGPEIRFSSVAAAGMTQNDLRQLQLADPSTVDFLPRGMVINAEGERANHLLQIIKEVPGKNEVVLFRFYLTKNRLYVFSISPFLGRRDFGEVDTEATGVAALELFIDDLGPKLFSIGETPIAKWYGKGLRPE